MAKRKKPLRWMCITRCYDSQCKMWEVGNIFKGDTPPMPKHFQQVRSGGKNPIEAIRDRLDDMGVGWELTMSLEDLQKRLKNEEYKQGKEATKLEEYPVEKEIQETLKGKDAKNKKES